MSERDQIVSDQILKGSRKAGKHYDFDENHDETLPSCVWFQESQEGLILFIVFYSQACRWSRCLGCNLPRMMSQRHIPYRSLMKQVDHVFHDPQVVSKLPMIRKVIASNNGSILDQETFSSTALMYFLANLNIHVSDLKVLSIETRPEYVEFAELEFIARALRESDSGTQLEIAVGFEAFDDHIRNQIFDKGLTLEAFENLVKEAARYGYHIKAYFMQKPVPGITDSEAIEDIKHAIDFLSRITSQYKIPINLHLNPTYVSEGTVLEDKFRAGEYFPPRLRDVAAASLHARNKPITVFIGLSDEGLTVEGGSFIRPGEEDMVRQLELFNRTQDFSILEVLCR